MISRELPICTRKRTQYEHHRHLHHACRFLLFGRTSHLVLRTSYLVLKLCAITLLQVNVPVIYTPVTL